MTFLITLAMGITIPFKCFAATTLPEGALVRYGGAECAQLSPGTLWIAGVIDKKGKFTSFASSISALNRKIKKASGSTKTRLKKQLKSLQKKAKQLGTVCSTLGTGVAAVTGSQSAASGFNQILWTDDMKIFIPSLSNANSGEIYSYFCPPNGTIDTVWGTDTYTADSSICNAAVHAGLITSQNGGNVRLKIKNGLSQYIGSTRNRVNSLMYSSFDVSYSFLNISTGNEIGSTTPPIMISGVRITTFRGSNETVYSFICAANGSVGSLWGTGTYTDDSVVCTAAAHIGKTTLLKGGVVNVVIRPGQTSYVGSKRNKITSNNYGNWNGSISFN